MLMSMNVGGGGGGGAPEMSVQQSLHIGLAPMNLQISKIKLLSDEETAKGVMYRSIVNSWFSISLRYLLAKQLW